MITNEPTTSYKEKGKDVRKNSLQEWAKLLLPTTHVLAIKDRDKKIETKKDNMNHQNY